MASSTDPHFCLSDIVTLIAGAEKKVFSVHRELICAHSDYFRGLFQGKFAESGQSSIELEDPPIVVTIFLTWLYQGSITLSVDHLGHLVLVPIYAFADRICSEEYMNDLMDAIRAAHRRQARLMGPKVVMRLYDRGLQTSQAAKFGVQSIVFDMVQHPGRWKDGKGAEGIQSWSTNSEVMIDVQKEIWNTLEAMPSIAPDALTGCVFHEHKVGQKCSPNKRKRGREESRS